MSKIIEGITNSISLQPGLPMAEVLQHIKASGQGNGRIRSFQVSFHQPDALTPGDFSQLLQAAFSLQKPLDPTAIPYDNSPVEKSDQDFTQDFKYKIVYLASANITPIDGYLQTWIGPTLVFAKHPLATENGNHLHIETSQSAPFVRRWRQDLLLPENQIVAAHYMRFTVLDKLKVLGLLLSEIAEQKINICEIRQPFSQEGQPAEIAILFDPARTELVHAARTNVMEKLKDYSVAVKAMYRVLGNPTQDLSRKAG